jgi:predicted DNA-binding protein (MmcQ/YjbR family)
MNPPSISAARLARLRAICLSFPEALEVPAWGDPTWRVRARIFAMQKGNYRGGRPSLWLKVGRDRQQRLIDDQPELFFVPPYVGHKGWVGMYLDATKVSWPQLRELVEESYQLIAPKKLAGGVAAARPSARARPLQPRPLRRSAAARK